MVLAAFARSEVVWTEEAAVCQHYAASSHTVVIGVIGHRTADAFQQSAFGVAEVERVGDVAGEADMKGTADAFGVGLSGGKGHNAVCVVELSTQRNHAPLYSVIRLFAHKTRVGSCFAFRA